MKPFACHAVVLLLGVVLLTGCGGPSQAELRVELQSIENEMMQLEVAAYHLRSQMKQADWQGFIGGFATGFGTMTGNGQLALDGGGVVVEAAGAYDRAGYGLQQVQNRYNQLAMRRAEILRRLR
ncbi:MAG: hypothetical protein KDM64_05820 [Verrucomicrobiae bacterium]|nr:hypothetical protein [Verrucomicrobiae bacterium]